MNILSLAYFTAFMIYVWLFIYVLAINPKNKTNRVYSLVIICYIIWDFSFVFFNAADSPNNARQWLHISSFGWCYFSSFYLWFSLIFTRKDKILKKWYFYFFLLLIPLFFVYKQSKDYLVFPVVKTFYGWGHLWVNSIWSNLFSFYYFINMTISLFLILTYGNNTKIIYEKKQTRTIFIFSIMPLILGSITNVVLPKLNILIIPPIGPIITIIASAGMVYAITKYKLMSLTPAYAASNILSTMSDSLVLIDLAGKIAEANNATLNLLGYKKDEIIGRKASLLFAADERLMNETLLFKAENLEKSFNNGSIVNHRVKYITKNSEEIPIDYSGSLLREKNGEIVGIVCIARDMRDIVKSEEQHEILQKKLVQSEKMAAVGQLAGGVAHELNNPLGVILGFAQSIIKRIKDDDPLFNPLKSIEREVIRCKRLIGDLLTFSRAEKPQDEIIDINKTIDETLLLIEAKSKLNNIEIIKDYGIDLPSIKANKDQIQQIIINLCNNSIDAMSDGGNITITTKQVANQLEIDISDTGIGMTEEIKKHIFEPFFTTKEVGKGTGLGLSLCYEMIQSHNGIIEFESEVNKGSTFIIKLTIK